MPKHETINYLELPAQDLAATKAFSEECFGWKFVDYGENYAAFSDAAVDGGFYRADAKSLTTNGSALLIFYSERLEDTLKKVEQAGRIIVLPTFEFPGGRRFQFTEPSGNELAVWSDRDANGQIYGPG